MILLVGVNHRSAPVGVREKLAFPEADLPAVLGRLVASDSVCEGMILSTCNRVEILVRTEGTAGSPEQLRDFLARERELGANELDGHVYHFEGVGAVRHLFRVASGLDSMILGEPQILGQVKQAYRVAREAGSTGPILDHLVQQGFSTAKQVRTRTAISRHAVSVAFAAVELARKIFSELKGRSVLVVGAGKMCGLAVKHLMANGIERVYVSGRTYQRAAAFAERFNGEAVPWANAWDNLDRVDVVVSGTGAPGTVLSRMQVQAALRRRRRRSGPLFVIDMAVPRDVEPDVNDLENVYLYDIDDLQDVVDSNLNERRRAAAEGNRLVEGEVQAFERWYRSLKVTPTIVQLREGLLEVGRKEIQRFRRRLGPLTPDQERAVEDLTRGLIQKVLHRPIRHLKEVSDRGDANQYAALYRTIFGLTETPASGEEPPRATDLAEAAPGAANASRSREEP